MKKKTEKEIFRLNCFAQWLQHHQIDTSRVVKLKFHLPPYNYVFDCLSLTITSVCSRQIITSINREAEKKMNRKSFIFLSRISTIFAHQTLITDKKKLFAKRWYCDQKSTLQLSASMFCLCVPLSSYLSVSFPLPGVYMRIITKNSEPHWINQRKIAYYWNNFNKH